MAKSEVIGEYEGRRIARMLRQLHLGDLRHDEGFDIAGWQQGGWVTISFVLTDGRWSYPVEARIDLARQAIRPAQAKDVLVDLLGHFFALYLSDGREPFTGPKWEQVDMAGVAVFVRGQEQQPEVEAMATTLLADDARRTAGEESVSHATDTITP